MSEGQPQDFLAKMNKIYGPKKPPRVPGKPQGKAPEPPLDGSIQNQLRKHFEEHGIK